jgi:hypothetical protein
MPTKPARYPKNHLTLTRALVPSTLEAYKALKLQKKNQTLGYLESMQKVNK